MYFTNTPALNSIEAIMRKLPCGSQKGGGRYRSPYKYTKENCDCRFCLSYRKETGCTLTLCPVLDVRLSCGAAPIGEAVKAVFKDAKNTAFQKRLSQIYKAANVFSLSFSPCLYRLVLPQISLGGFTLLCQTLVTFQLGGLVLNGSGIFFDAPLGHLSPHFHFGKECHYLVTMLVSATCIVQYSSSSHSLSATSTWKAPTKKMPLSFLLLEMNLHTFLSLSISWIS